ncbi:DUF3943 domain-containing protein [Ideonella sp. YS5]|uniref:DUF3943 domain-containing protein n=1 Tax=Ideonella sp. YS5 TaxID=3453714 RepID=UPI003EEC64F3
MRAAASIPLWTLALLLPSLAAGQSNAADDPEPDSSYAIPAAEIIVFDLSLSAYNRHFSGSSDYDVSWESIQRNLKHSWVTDNDPFQVNQFAHPYQGSLYHGAARSAGLNYWEASAMTFLGSAWWEITGERTPPAVNDQVASGIAGSFFGEPLFRMARLVMDRSDLPDHWRYGLAAAISPPLGLNRLLYGGRFDKAFSDNDPAYYGRLRIGAAHATQTTFEPSPSFDTSTGQLDFAMDYGLPGKPGYSYRRPFDYFSFHALLSSANSVESLQSRGLLFGTDYAAGDKVRGLWGLYASYDYLAPQIFDVSSTALSVGTTAQWWMSRQFALQGTALIGLGYSAASSGRGTAATDRNYHYGVAPQAGLSLRLTSGQSAAFDVSAQTVALGSIARRNAGRDNLSRIEAALTWRIHGPHAIGIGYQWSHRSTSSRLQPDSTPSIGTVMIGYVLLGQQGFGSVDWRASAGAGE